MNSVEWCSSSLTNNGLTNQNTVPRDRSNLVRLDNENSNEDDGIDFIGKRNISFQEREEVDNEDQERVQKRKRCEDNDMELKDGKKKFWEDGPRSELKKIFKRPRCEDGDEWEDDDAPYFDQQRYREEDVDHNIGSTDDDPYFDEVDEDDEFLWGDFEHEYQVNRREYDETGAFLELANNWDGQQRTEWHDDDPDFEGIEYDYPDSDDLMEDDR